MVDEADVGEGKGGDLAVADPVPDWANRQSSSQPLPFDTRAHQSYCAASALVIPAMIISASAYVSDLTAGRSTSVFISLVQLNLNSNVRR